MTDLPTLTAVETTELVRKKTISPVETVRAAIERIEQRNPSINAVIFTDFEGALNQAADLEKRIMRGDNVGPLAGLPSLMKDLFDFKPGWPSTLGGIPSLRDYRPNVWSTYPRKMEAAGAILLGKTNSPVMGFRGTTDNPLFGPTKNPFELSKNSGGSSGGSAAAVADGLVPVAGASDGGGSIRIPASWCGVVGFQPSFGRVPLITRPNAFEATSPFVYQGPIARTVADIALVMDSLAGYDPHDPFSIATPTSFAEPLPFAGLAGKRIGYTADFGIFPVEREVGDCVASAVQAFADAGATIDEVQLVLPFSVTELSDLWCRLITAGSCAALRNLKHSGIDLLGDNSDEMPEPLLHWLRRVSEQSLEERQRDQEMRSIVFDAFADLFLHYDLIASPTTAALPVDNATGGLTNGPSQINGIEVDPQIGWCMTYLTNMTGNAAASVPCGMSRGLPVGLQIIGRRYGDMDVLAACAAFERLRPWKNTYKITQARTLVA
ncbi:amidase family protein [Rhizobium calliandrae]|uniref:Indoleacetamide hydrolase n=1 Tax=Rhizobium calliandrae TaxID=1312182 RepID=A0ABT7KB78_9HYPH|nr:amidase family protein [Rhizobium calliandrae]MDL2405869.1 amidase family protein [Rhizobium calliandrae]